MKLKGDRNSLKRASAIVCYDCTTFCKEFSEFILSKKCRALAAPQVGEFIRVIGIKSRNKRSVQVLVNPTILKESATKVEKPESCISLGKKQVSVKRPKWVYVTYQAPDLSKKKTSFFFGRQAAAVCHTIDLLNGKLIY